MKLRAIIAEAVLPESFLIVIKFEGDNRNKKFHVACSFNPFQKGMRIFETWELILKLDSEEVITDGFVKYETILTCDKASPVEEIGKGK
ncbi:hypothetical protein [Chryseobacterium mulctrae]|uniref:hypothetical protein n=1 Tax=Chryseobacterium mulctrae TaxID=2576777 RepID=UPI001115F055|nr:hypothetical protein [Chryseobacterium mulctrae]